MTASNTDLLKKYLSLFSTTLSTGIGTGTGDTITPASVSGLATDTAVTLTIDRVDSGGVATPTKMERIKGVISGGNLTSYVRGVDGTTEQAHSAGAVVEMVWNSDDWNNMVDWGLVSHNQDGSIGASKVVASNISASAVTAGKLAASSVVAGNLAASVMATSAEVATGTDDTKIVTPLAATGIDTRTATFTNKTLTSPIISGAGGTTAGQQGYDATDKAIFIGDGAAKQSIYTSAWKAYTPSLTNITLGDGTLVFTYARIGKIIHVRGYFKHGTTTSISGLLTFDLPATATATYEAQTFPCYILDSGTAEYAGLIQIISGKMTVKVINSSGTYAIVSNTSATAPMTWANNDYLSFYLTYEAA